MFRAFVYAVAASSVAFVAAPALAADAVIYNEPAPTAVSAPFTWTGFYLGAFGGLQQGDTEYDINFTDSSGSIFDNSRSVSREDSAGGFIGGVQVGYDYQIGNFVVGAFADIAATNLETDSEVFDTFNGAGTSRVEYELDYLGTVQGRIGYAMDRLLVYGRGGFAYGDVTVRNSTSGAGFSASEEFDTDMKYGYTVGAGAEYALTDRISLQADYAYTDLGSDDFDVSEDFASDFSNGFGSAADVNGSESIDFHTVKFGVNFRF